MMKGCPLRICGVLLSGARLLLIFEMRFCTIMVELRPIQNYNVAFAIDFECLYFSMFETMVIECNKDFNIFGRTQIGVEFKLLMSSDFG